MNHKYFIYLEKNKDSKTKEEYTCRRYYRKKLKPIPERLQFVGTAELSKDYFIVGSETHHTDIIDLSSIELEYTAVLRGGSTTSFRHNIQDLLHKAKEGYMPYITFEGFKVTKKPRLVITGKKHTTNNPLDINVL